MYLDKYSGDTIVKVTSSPSPRRGKPVVLMVEDHHDAQLELKQVLTKKRLHGNRYRQRAGCYGTGSRGPP